MHTNAQRPPQLNSTAVNMGQAHHAYVSTHYNNGLGAAGSSNHGTGSRGVATSEQKFSHMRTMPNYVPNAQYASIPSVNTSFVTTRQSEHDQTYGTSYDNGAFDAEFSLFSGDGPTFDEYADDAADVVCKCSFGFVFAFLWTDTPL